MTPEEHLRALRDHSLWDAEFAPRESVTPQRRRPWALVATVAVTLVVAVAVVLGAVSLRGSVRPAPIASPEPTVTSTPTPTFAPSHPPTPSSTPTPAAAGSRPPQMFGGDCSAIMSVEEFIDAGGAADATITTTPPDESLEADEIYAIFAHGGLRCQWVSSGLSVTLDAVSTTDLPAAADQPCAVRGTSKACRFDVTVQGARFSASVSAASSRESTQRAAVIRDLFIARAKEGAPEPSAPPVGTWPAASCATLVEDLRSVVPDFVPHLLGHMEGKPALTQDLVRATFVDSNLGCEAMSASTPGGGQFIGAYGGGAWMRPLLTALPGTKQITVAGFDYSYRYTPPPSAGGGDRIWLFRGPNAIRMSYPTKSYAAYMAALNDLADHLDAESEG
jgi:hypothetical protein